MKAIIGTSSEVCVNEAKFICQAKHTLQSSKVDALHRSCPPPHSKLLVEQSHIDAAKLFVLDLLSHFFQKKTFGAIPDQLEAMNATAINISNLYSDTKLPVLNSQISYAHNTTRS
jgi:hypothetical protein